MKMTCEQWAGTESAIVLVPFLLPRTIYLYLKCKNSLWEYDIFLEVSDGG